MIYNMRIENKLYKQVQKINKFPKILQSFILNIIMSKNVPFLKTTNIKFTKINREEVIVTVKNTKKIQNHIHGIHACVMALLAETSSGFILGINVPDEKIVLLKSMEIKYNKIAKGNMKAIATINDEQVVLMQNEDRGNIIVPVQVYDETNQNPIQVKMNWAWILKK